MDGRTDGQTFLSLFLSLFGLLNGRPQRAIRWIVGKLHICYAHPPTSVVWPSLVGKRTAMTVVVKDAALARDDNPRIPSAP